VIIFKEMDVVKQQHHRVMTLTAVAALALVVAGCAPKTTKHSSANPTSSNVPLSTNQIKKNLDSKLISTREDRQASLTKVYQTAAKSSKYTLSNPYIKVNPYKTSPLSALVTFKTPQAAKVSYTVVGKTSQTSLTNTVHGGYMKTHQVPVVGLYANYNNTVKLKVTTKAGTTKTTSVKLQTGHLPKYVRNATVTVKNVDKSKMSIGDNKLTLLNRTTKEPMAVDADGAVRWYSTNYSQHIFEQWSNGHVMTLTKKTNSSQVYNDLTEIDLLGRVYNEYSFSSKTGSSDSSTGSAAVANKKNTVSYSTLIHHDIIELPSHNLLATVSDGSKYKEDTMVEISHKTGKIVKVIDLKKLLPKSMWTSYKKGADGKIDWFHQNSIDYDKNDDSIIISGRNQDMIMKIDYQTKQIKWIYSGKKKATWPKRYQKYVLTPTKGTTITGGQHALSLLSDTANNPASEDVILYDNNTAVTNGDKKTSGNYSQAVQYHIDAKQMTIDQTWAWGKSLGKANFTDVIGYAERQSNGNTLVDFGFKNTGKQSNVIEVTKSGKQVWNMTIKNAASKAYVYRAYRMPFYDAAYVFDATK